MEDLILVILAAGDSRRFKGNKLLYLLQEKPMYQYLIEQIEQLPSDLFSKKIVVTQYDEIKETLGRKGYCVVENHNSELGISHSIHLAIQSLEGKPAALCFAVCDQPYLRHETIEQLVGGWRQSGRGIGCLSHNGEFGNPVIFSEKYRQELLELEGDVGGKRVLRRHLEDLFLCEVEHGKELMDVDIRMEL